MNSKFSVLKNIRASIGSLVVSMTYINPTGIEKMLKKERNSSDTQAECVLPPSSSLESDSLPVEAFNGSFYKLSESSTHDTYETILSKDDVVSLSPGVEYDNFDLRGGANVIAYNPKSDKFESAYWVSQSGEPVGTWMGEPLREDVVLVNESSEILQDNRDFDKRRPFTAYVSQETGHPADAYMGEPLMHDALKLIIPDNLK